MSSFAGRMKEYPTISLDRFDRENLHARAYFLSHCHKDHMKGLSGPLLRTKLRFSRTVRLYCSFVTKELLLSNPKYAFWEEYIVPLELESPTQISLVDEASGEKEDVVVTLLPAGHCPGSVMFLFEGSHGNVLYTGDFRLAAGDASRMELLHAGSRVKDIQSIYLDSTFYDPQFYQIPSREVCLNGISKLIGDWISQSSHHVAWLNCKAAFGYEYLFTNLGEELNSQIHVNSLEMFKKMPEILSYVTTDRRTQIHACRHPKAEEFFHGSRLPCGCTAPDGTPLRIISIKPSTMWFGDRTKKPNVVVQTGASSFRACFSFHSSYSELKDFLSYLQPVNIYPSVVPIGQTLSEVTQMLNMMCRKQSDQVFIYKPLGELKRSRAARPTYDSGSDDELFDSLDLAPVRKKIGLSLEIGNVKAHSPQKTAPPVFLEESLPAEASDKRRIAYNYMDCTESNDEEDEETEGIEDAKLMEEGLKRFIKKNEINKETDRNQTEDVGRDSSNPPKWEDFFTTETLPDSQSSLNSQSCCSVPSPSASRVAGSQTPDRLGDEEDTPNIDGNFNLTLSASLSSHSSQNPESCLPDTLILHPEQAGWGKGDAGANRVSQEKDSNGQNVQSNIGELPDSQSSSDFDIPGTPESEMPQADELLLMYRKLASGEDLDTVKGPLQGF
ncbi:protein artemis [Brachionichthys hirsutus]|uniref:protein artemis n=1 Tax=Brachionichthys hirsutus TaxID=412623 RepID=UPI003604609A